MGIMFEDFGKRKQKFWKGGKAEKIKTKILEGLRMAVLCVAVCTNGGEWGYWVERDLRETKSKI